MVRKNLALKILGKLPKPLIDGFFKFATTIFQWYWKIKEKFMATKFEKEREDIMMFIEEAITKILLSEDRVSKHDPYTWLDEDVNQHLLKCSRHINTYMQIQQGYQEPDGENHLNNAICRLSMAIAKIGLTKQKLKKE